MVRSFLKDVRALEIENINFDLIYGLPGQSLSSIEETIAIVKEMKPTTIALYGYAHVPWRSKAQKSLERYKIAAGEEKRALYERSKELLLDVGYRELGLDHFALEGSELMSAYERGELKRTFMGYTAQKAPVTLGLGASAISSSPRTFVQNEKDVKSYSEKLASDKLPLFNGHILSVRDQACSQVIQSIMCQGKAEYEDLLNLLGDTEKAVLLGELQELFEDGLIEYNAKSLRVLERGKPFLRNISMIFDHRLTKVQNQFSKTV
jgi:oxygen-independent coproporphyrinogen-3 oxidase